MATVAVTPAASADAGVDPTTTPTAATAGNTYNVAPGDKPIVLVATNAGSGSANLTLTIPAVAGVRPASTKVVAVAGGQTKVIGPLDPNVYANPSFIVSAAVSVKAIALGLTFRKSID